LSTLQLYNSQTSVSLLNLQRNSVRSMGSRSRTSKIASTSKIMQTQQRLLRLCFQSQLRRISTTNPFQSMSTGMCASSLSSSVTLRCYSKEFVKSNEALMSRSSAIHLQSRRMLARSRTRLTSTRHVFCQLSRMFTVQLKVRLWMIC
jgi:hypothetical protein